MTGEWIAVDGGQSGSRVRVSWRDRVFEGAGFVHGPGRVAAMVAALEPAFAELGELPAVEVLAAGHTGLPVLEAERAELARLLSARTGARRVLLAADWVTAHLGALGGGPGVVVAAGTGAVALGVGPDGTAHRVDGEGYLFGDAGGGWWIGRSALALALRDRDGRASAPAVAAAARARFGHDLHAAAWALYAEPAVVDTVARFAPEVIALAGEGDAPATLIVSRAAEALAASAAAAGRDLTGSVPVAVTGRLLDPAGELGRRFRLALPAALPAAVLQPARGGPLDGAAVLASAGPGIHDALVTSYQEFT